MKKIFLVGGGTGGHFFAAVALGQELLNRGHTVHLITDSRCQKYISDLVNEFKIHVIKMPAIPSNIVKKAFAYLKLLASCIEGIRLVKRHSPDIIVAFGGYTITPIIIGGILFEIPFILHEQNSHLGKANRFFSRYAKVITTAYKNVIKLNECYNHKVMITGNPIRKIIRSVKEKNFDLKSFKILVLGGSQGAHVFAGLVPAAIALVIKKHSTTQIEVTHQAISRDIACIELAYSKLGVKHEVRDFFSNVIEKYQQSHIVICRAGAGTISEIISLCLPAILIPYPFAADNHQWFNAQTLASNNAGWCMKQDMVTPSMLADKIIEIVKCPDILLSVAQKLRNMQVYSEQILADVVEKTML